MLYKMGMFSVYCSEQSGCQWEDCSYLGVAMLNACSMFIKNCCQQLTDTFTFQFTQFLKCILTVNDSTAYWSIYVDYMTNGTLIQIQICKAQLTKLSRGTKKVPKGMLFLKIVMYLPCILHCGSLYLELSICYSFMPKPFYF